jgi:beta-arrestin
MSDIEPIDGVVLIDPEYVKDRKVFVHVLAAFRYGRDDLDVLGLTFRKDLFIAQQQIYPPLPDQLITGTATANVTTTTSTTPKTLTHLQQRLLRKLGSNAYPFFFQLPKSAPASVTLQPATGDTGKPCGVDYELKTYCAEDLDDKTHKRNSVRLAIRKLTYAPPSKAPQPMVDGHKEFMMSSAPLHLECTLDKEQYYHGESINVNVQVTNNSNKTVKKIRVTVIQSAEIMLYSATQYKCDVAELETTDGFPLNPSSTMSKVYTLTPTLANNKDKRGLALDGKLKHEDTSLASSTILYDGCDKENIGIIVQYRVKVKLIVSLGSDLSVEMPFTLTHPKPEAPPPPETSTSTNEKTKNSKNDEKKAVNDQTVPVDMNLIQFDTK